jgi:hypothetical protein
LGKGKKPFKKGSFSFAATHPFPLSRRSPKGEDGKPFIGIYLFAMQKDKCLSRYKLFEN